MLYDLNKQSHIKIFADCIHLSMNIIRFFCLLLFPKLYLYVGTYRKSSSIKNGIILLFENNLYCISDDGLTLTWL